MCVLYYTHLKCVLLSAELSSRNPWQIFEYTQKRKNSIYSNTKKYINDFPKSENEKKERKLKKKIFYLKFIRFGTLTQNINYFGE